LADDGTLRAGDGEGLTALNGLTEDEAIVAQGEGVEPVKGRGGRLLSKS
jgi:hypothetical protein